MKIAYFLDVPKGFGGAGNLLLQQAILMSTLYSVIVVIPSDSEGNYNDEYAQRCKRFDISFVCIEYSTSYNFSDIDFVGTMHRVASIEDFARKEEIDFFHSVQLNIAVEYVARKLKIPHLMDSYQLREEEFRICQWDIYPHYHLCDSILYSKRWSEQLGIKSKCIRPIALLNVMKKKQLSSDKIKILMLGGLATRKNQMTAIKAVEYCAASIDIELHIAGNMAGDYSEECRKYVEEHRLDNSIFFYGFVSDIIPLLEKCDCLLCSSTEESFPSSIVEALTYDLTIISTPVAGVPEVFVDKKNSFISKDFSMESISQSILECVESYQSGKIIEIHQNAEKTWINNFKRDTVREKINLYYKEIVSEMFFGRLSSFDVIIKDIEEVEEILYEIKEKETWICKRFLYYTFIKKKVHKGKIYIWGAGKFGRLAFEMLHKLCPDVEVVAFIDMKKEGTYCGIPIIKLGGVPVQQNVFYTISFISDRDEAISYLEDNGLELNRQILIIP